MPLSDNLSDKNWTPRQLGAKARFVARAIPELLTLSGSRILGLANDGGTAGPMAADLAGSLLYDTSVRLGGKGSLRTDSTAANLFVAAGGTTGTEPFHLAALVQILAQPDVNHQDATFMLAGPPGSDGTHRNSGIGALNANNGPWLYAGGQQNPIISGSTSNPGAVHDTGVHFIEAVNDGASLTLYMDGGKVGSTPGVTSLSSGRMGYCGTYPLPVYGPPDSRIWWSGFLEPLTAAERVQLLRYIKREFGVRPKRFISVTGDSITAGHINGPGGVVSTTSYVESMRSQYAAAGETVYILNAGISSQTTAEIAARSPSTFVDYYAPPGSNFREQWLCINGGKNDNFAAVSPAQAYTNLASISVAAQALGVKTAMSTAFYGTPDTMTAGLYAWADGLNMLIRANSCGADRVCDFMLDPVVASPTHAGWPDGVHPNDTTLGVMAARMIATIG